MDKFPDSPTAQRHKKALFLYFNGYAIIENYKKHSVKSEADCDEVGEGFQLYVQGYILESHMKKQFLLQPSVLQLLEQYRARRPNDYLSEYLYLIMKIDTYLDKGDYTYSKFELRTLEELAHKLEPFKTVSTEKSILSSVYYRLGARYHTTSQFARSEDSFKKLYALDTNDIDAIHLYILWQL